MEELYRKRPFKTRNADEYNLSDILSLFVSPIEGLSSPLEFENSIIKGRMGSGKTIYLRANYAYYLFNIIPCLIDETELILPVFIKLSDFQHIRNPEVIYEQIIIKIIEELSTIYLKLQDNKQMANIHIGMKRIKSDLYFEEKIRNTTNLLLKLGSDEYIEKIDLEFQLNGKSSFKFIEAALNFKKNNVVEVKQKKSPGINDIFNAYDILLKDTGGKILLLIDEAGALDKTFFKDDISDSVFEILMNQLRTADFIRTKVAIYPNSYSDILTETRYGDIVALEEDIYNIENYKLYRKRVESIIRNYLNVDNETKQWDVYDIFEKENENGADCIEELINGSGGNYRRLIQLLDITMNEAFKVNKGKEKVRYEDVVNALKRSCEGVLALYSDIEKEYLANLAKVCKSRSTYRFKYPNNAQLLYKFMSRSQEFNLLKVIDAGSGRKGTTYAFDYAYCVYRDIPTHYVKGSEKIEKLRNLTYGEWISRITSINNELIAQCEIPNKIEGEIVYLSNGKGFVKGEDGYEYYFSKEYVIESDSNKLIWQGKRLKFNPSMLGDSRIATEIEIL